MARRCVKFFNGAPSGVAENYNQCGKKSGYLHLKCTTSPNNSKREMIAPGEKVFCQEKRHYHNHRCSPAESSPGRENLRRVTYGLIRFEVRRGPELCNFPIIYYYYCTLPPFRDFFQSQGLPTPVLVSASIKPQNRRG